MDNENNFCRKCGNKLREGAKFCNMCGTPVADVPAVPVPEPGAGQPVINDAKPSGKKSKKPSVFAFVTGFIALAALVTLVIICPEIYSKDDVFMYICIGISAFAALSVLCFIISKKNKLAVLSGVVSMLTLAALGAYVFAAIPKLEKNAHNAYMEKLEHVGTVATRDTYVNIEAYPYNSLRNFYVREAWAFSEVKDEIKDHYNKGEYSEWIASSMFVYKTLDLSANGSDIKNDIITKCGSDIDPYLLKDYAVLFADTPFAKDYNSSGYDYNTLGRMKSDLEGRIDQAQKYLDEGKSTIIQSYGGKFYLYSNFVLYDAGSSFAVVDLTNGNCFSTGDYY